MTREFSFRHLALPLLASLFLPTLALAQAGSDYCEPTPVIKADLKKVSDVYEQNLPFTTRLERQKQMMLELLSKYPNDFFVQRRYQDARRAGFFTDIDPVVADYRSQMEKNPNDPVAVYLYARILIGRQTKEAVALAEKLTQQTPEFPWTHLQLAEIYNYPNFKDVTKSKDHLKQCGYQVVLISKLRS